LGSVALNPEAAIIEDIFDCPKLLSELSRSFAARSAREPDDSSAALEAESGRRGAISPRKLLQQIESDWDSLSRRYEPVRLDSTDLERGDYLVIPTRDSRAVRTLSLTKEVTEILKLFEAPRPIGDYLALVCASSANPLLGKLLEFDALIPAALA
jgi:hypothetical protein